MGALRGIPQRQHGDHLQTLHLREGLDQIHRPEHTHIGSAKAQIRRLQHHLGHSDGGVDLAVVLAVMFPVPGLLGVIPHANDHRGVEVAVHAGVCLFQSLLALQHLVDFRKQEGAALEKKFNEKIDNIARLLESIEPFEKERVSKIRDRITDALEKTISVDYDKNRLEQELIYYIEKLDINEEKQRLANHLKYFRETMAGGHGQGKKLGFIAQEMGREINTTGSKSNHAQMQNIVVQMKDELEQIKEQVLNVM